jgi:aryl-alcohol dehydrogenase-like predicted oxidoreductase
MDLRPLGASGLRVSVLGLGTVKLGRNTAVKYPGGAYELPTDEQAASLLRTAAELGITLIDTAPAYGTSEERIGGLMAANGWFGGRDRWIVSTKVGEEFDAASGES